ncbi:MAG: type IX secretion system membrane protein PorP/SprF [Bacteroidota bacterium]
MKNFFFVVFLMIGFGLEAGAQVYFQNTMYSFNRFVYNPAAAGIQAPGTDYTNTLTLLGRQQWVGIEGAPRLMSASYNTYLKDLQSGVGAYVIQDRLGPIATTGLNVAYNYRIELNSPYSGTSAAPYISIGINGGLLQKSLNGNFVYNQDNGPDPLVPVGSFSASALVPSLGAGVYLRGANDQFFVGLSGQDLLEPSLESILLTQGVGEDTDVDRSFMLMGGYRFELNTDMSLEPQVFVRTDGIFPPQVDVSVYWRYKPAVFGVNYRFFNDSFSGIFGFNVLDRAFIGYSFDYGLNALNALGDGNSHEIIVSWSFPSSDNTPRRETDIKSGNPGDIR